MDPAQIVALCISAVLLLAIVWWIVAVKRRTHYTIWQAPWYLLNLFFTRVLWHTQVTGGPLPVADDQGAVIVCNHRSGIDPLLIQLAANRVVHWMVAREYYEGFGISIVFKTLRSIPVNRGGVDTAATKMAIRLAQQGGLVGLFPEGKVNLTDDLLLPGRPGAALIALKARVPVIPCYVSGVPYDGTALGSFFMRAQARCVIGQPIDLTEFYGREHDKAVLQEVTKRLLVGIAELAGVPNFEPQVAGRNWKTDGENGNGDNGNGADQQGADHASDEPADDPMSNATVKE